MKTIFLFLFILFLAAFLLPHIATAVNDTLSTNNCDSLGFVPSLCGTLREYSTKAGWNTDQEKRYLLNIFAEGGIMPNHEFIKDWNSKIVFGDEAPNNQSTDNKPCSDLSSMNCIADAWIRTFSVMPSFNENNTIYIKGTGQVQTGYYYDLSTPPTTGRNHACSRSMPSNNRYGDCKTVFNYEDLSTLKVEMDGNIIFEGLASELGDNKLTGFSTYADSPSFKSTLKIKNRIQRDHYEWDKGGVCKKVCRTSCGMTGCTTKCTTYYDYDCEFENTDYVEETMTLTDNLDGNIKRYYTPPTSHDIVIENVDLNPEGIIVTDATDFKLFMNNAVMHKAGSKYPMDYSYAPYNILALEREPASSYFVEDLHIQNAGDTSIEFTTYPYNMDECSFVVLNPFGYETESCNLLKKATTELSIETKQRRHRLDEDVELKIDFDSDDGDDQADLVIDYAGNKRTVSVNGVETINLVPVEGYNTIRVEFAGDAERSSIEAIPIGVYASDDTFVTYLGLALVFFVVYGMGYFARRYLPR